MSVRQSLDICVRQKFDMEVQFYDRKIKVDVIHVHVVQLLKYTH